MYKATSTRKYKNIPCHLSICIGGTIVVIRVWECRVGMLHTFVIVVFLIHRKTRSGITWCGGETFH